MLLAGVGGGEAAAAATCLHQQNEKRMEVNFAQQGRFMKTVGIKKFVKRR